MHLTNQFIMHFNKHSFVNMSAIFLMFNLQWCWTC